MATGRRLYNRIDQWARNLSRVWYAVFLGAAAAVGVLVIGLLVSAEIRLVRALTLGVVMFALEYTFGWFQTADE